MPSSSTSPSLPFQHHSPTPSFFQDLQLSFSDSLRFSILQFSMSQISQFKSPKFNLKLNLEKNSLQETQIFQSNWPKLSSFVHNWVSFSLQLNQKILTKISISIIAMSCLTLSLQLTNGSVILLQTWGRFLPSRTLDLLSDFCHTRHAFAANKNNKTNMTINVYRGTHARQIETTNSKIETLNSNPCSPDSKV